MKNKTKVTMSCFILAMTSLFYSNATLAATLDQAYATSLSGNIQVAEKMYQELITENKVPKHEIYFSQCLAAIKRFDLLYSDQIYALAYSSLANHDDREAILTEFNYRRAALLINKGESGRAILVLKPYVFSSNSNIRMQSDYLDANFRLGNYTYVVKTAYQFWHQDYNNVPTYGVLVVADSLFKLKNYHLAQKLYELVLSRDKNNFFATLSMAYCLAMRSQDDLSFKTYQCAYDLRADSESLILNEVNILLANDKRKLAKRLYKMLEDKSTNKDKIKFAKAASLATNTYIMDSNRTLASIENINANKAAYWSQIFANSLNNELYYTATQSIANLVGTNMYADAKIKYKNARKAGMGTSFMTTSNYKGNSIQSYRLDGDVYIGSNTSIVGIIENTRLSDKTTTNSVTTSTVGLIHRFERGKISLNLTDAVSGSSHTLYDIGFTYKINDLTELSFAMGKQYVMDSKAVANGFILENYHNIGIAHKFNKKNSVFFDYTTSTLTDSNHYDGYGISYSYYPFNDALKSHELFTYYRRGGFSKLSDYYETPDKRIAYGLGWQARWNNPKTGAYWTLRLNLELGYDNLEPTDFSPSARLMYTHPTTTNQEFIIATEYGLRTNRMNDINRFLHGYKQLELKYNISW